ncbi:unnamed protein product [Lampetra planeri]
MQIETDAPIGSGNCSFEFIVSKQNVTSSVTVLSWCVLDGPQTRCHCGPGLLWSAAACRQVGACDDAAASGPSPSPGSAPSSYSGSSFFPSCTCIKGLPPDGVQCVPRPEPLPSCTTANPTDATTVLNATAVAAVVVNATATTEMTLNATATTEMTLNATVTSETTLNATVTTAVVLNTTATTTVVLNTTATTAVVLNTTATPVLGTTMATGGSNHTSSPYAPQDLKVVPVTLTISEVFNSALSDPNSLDYRTMSNRLLPSLTSSYQSLGSRFVQVAILNFRPGSVLASVNVSGYSLTDSEVTNLTALAIDALIAAGVPVIRDFNINGTTTNVTTERLNEILNQSKPKEVVEREVPILLQNLTMQTNPVGGSLTPDSIRAASAALGLIAMATQNKSIVFGKQVAESFLVTASNLLAMSNLDSWKSLQMLNQSDSSDLLGTVETFVTRMNTTSLATGTRGDRGDTERHWETLGDTRRHWETLGETRGDTRRHWETLGDTGRKQERLGDMRRHWETLGDRGKYWETRGDTGRKQERLGGMRRHWETLGDRGKYWETGGDTGRQGETLGDTGRHWKTGGDRGDTERHWETLGDTRRHWERHGETLGDTGGDTGRHWETLGDTGRKQERLGDMRIHWETLGDRGKYWETGEDTGRQGETLGDTGRHWETLGNRGRQGRH